MDKKLVLYALPAMCLAIMIGPAGSILQGIYTREFGLKLSDIAFFIIICRFFDALTDPAIGLLSDRTRLRWGGRKTWVAAGSIISIVAAYFLYLPPDNVTAFYFFLAFLFSYLGWTIVEIPHMAWGSELARSYHERTKLFSYRVGFLFFGTMLFLGIPICIAFYQVVFHGAEWGGISTEYTGETLAVAFWLLAVFFPITVFISLKYCPKGEVIETQKRATLGDMFKMLFWNKPLRLFVGVMGIFFIGNGMQVAVAYLHLSSYLGLADKAAIIYVVCYPLNIIFIPFWIRLAKRFDKHRAYALGVALSAAAFLLFGLMDPGEGSFLEYLIVFGLLQVFQASWIALPPAMLADISDYGTFKTGIDQSGTYYAFFTFLSKSFAGLGGAVGFGLAAWFGFDPTLDVHDDSSAFGVKMVMGYIPAFLGFIVAVLMLYFPITSRRHGIIQKALERRIVSYQ